MECSNDSYFFDRTTNDRMKIRTSSTRPRTTERRMIERKYVRRVRIRTRDNEQYWKTNDRMKIRTSRGCVRDSEQHWETNDRTKIRTTREFVWLWVKKCLNRRMKTERPTNKIDWKHCCSVPALYTTEKKAIHMASIVDSNWTRIPRIARGRIARGRIARIFRIARVTWIADS